MVIFDNADGDPRRRRIYGQRLRSSSCGPGEFHGQTYEPIAENETKQNIVIVFVHSHGSPYDGHEQLGQDARNKQSNQNPYLYNLYFVEIQAAKVDFFPFLLCFPFLLSPSLT